MRLRSRCLYLSAFLAICFARELAAQTTTSGGLTGVVTDQSGALVVNADVEIKDNSKGTTQSTKTDREGVYRFFFVAPARYTLGVTHQGFRPESRTVSVLLGPPVTVNVSLAVAKTSNEITVTGEAPLVQAENGDVSATMNQTQISELPNPGNDLTYIAQTAPGILMNTDIQATNFSSLGMPSSSTLFTVNGMNDNDNGFGWNNTGSLNLLLGQNQVQEATVVSIGYSGQFGGSAGGSVNYITKSGSNTLHGTAQYYWNGTALNANSWLNNATGVARPFDSANQWAASLGGPVKKDKLFFFLDAEGLRVLLPQTFLVAIPSPQFESATIANIDSRFGSTSASDAFYKRIFSLYNGAPGASSAQLGGWSRQTDPTGCTEFRDLGAGVNCALHYATSIGDPSIDWLASGRFDWNIGPKDHAFFQAQYDGGHIAFVDPINSGFDAYHKQPWWVDQFNEAHTFSSTAASQFLFAASYIGWWNRLADPQQALTLFPTSLNFLATNTYSSLAPFNVGGAVNAGRPTTQFQISEDIFKIAGKHSLGFGGTLERIYWTLHSYTSYLDGSLVPQTLDAFYQGGVDPANPSVDATQLTQSFSSEASGRALFLSLGLYGQDEWHARPNLTLTVALRGEHYSNPVCIGRCFARLSAPVGTITYDPAQPYSQGILTNERQALPGVETVLWSPRVSFAWQPLGVSRTSVLRGGIGIFYDPLPGNTALWLSTNLPRYNVYTVAGDNLSPNEKTNLFNDAAASNLAFVNGFNSGQTLAQIQGQIKGVSPPGFIPPALITPGTTHAAQYQRWSLEWQQAFGARTSWKVLYTGHHGIHELFLDPDANAWGFGSLPSSLCSSPPVPPCADPRFGEVTNAESTAVSNYNAVVLSFGRRIVGWGTGLLQVNYTYSHEFDEISDGGQNPFTSAWMSAPQNPSDLRGAYGPADYDVRHSLNASYVWEPPLGQLFRGHGWAPLFSGWQVSGTIFVHSGYPYTAVDVKTSSNLAVPNNYFGLLYAVPVGPIPSNFPCGESAANPFNPVPCLPAQVSANGDPSPNALFVQSGCETGFNTGNVPGPSGPCGGTAVSFAQGRNRFRAPGYFDTDLAIMKNTKFPHWESAMLGLG
ncbi:MAG TPA: carboxypeptidase regulatory-like domain-containing protein, partial [Candidatus Eremiobacteraceae bacterium]|nr:carboxypeptidase regulatory-like domain-containing protein [Candidatus Eremiobacteraceae bacterium]